MPAYNGIYFLVKLRGVLLHIYTKMAIYCDFFSLVATVYHSFNNDICHMKVLLLNLQSLKTQESSEVNESRKRKWQRR